MKYLFILLLFILSLFILSYYSLFTMPVWREVKPWVLDYDSSVVESLHTIICPYSNDCIALIPFGDYYARLYSSTDNGKTWQRFWDDFTGDYEDLREMSKGIAYPSKDKIYLTFYNSFMLKSSNRGQSWDTVRFEPAGVRLEYIYMPDTLNGFILNPYYTYLTNDGWETYRMLNTRNITTFYPSNPIMYGVDTLIFFSARNETSCFHYSYDAGQTWKTDTISNNIGFGGFSSKEVFAFKSGAMYLVGYYPLGIGDQTYDVIYKLDSINGNWREIYFNLNNPNFGLQGITFKDELNGVAVGQFGKVLRTTDGGGTWFQEFLIRPDNKYYESAVLHVTYAGDTPLIGDFEGRIFRLEDDGTGSVSEQEEISIYPNPANENININPWLLVPNSDLEIYNIYGEKLISVETAPSIDISSLCSGTYYLKIGTNIYRFVKV